MRRFAAEPKVVVRVQVSVLLLAHRRHFDVLDVVVGFVVVRVVRGGGRRHDWSGVVIVVRTGRVEESGKRGVASCDMRVSGFEW